MDLIDRQAAIDAIENAFDRETILNRFVRKIAISAVRLLPPAQLKELDTLIKALEQEHKKLREMQKAQPHTYRGVTLNDVLMYFDSLEGNEDAWTEFCSCLKCRGWGLYHIRSATDKNVGSSEDCISRQAVIDALENTKKVAK